MNTPKNNSSYPKHFETLNINIANNTNTVNNNNNNNIRLHNKSNTTRINNKKQETKSIFPSEMYKHTVNGNTKQLSE